MPNFIGLLIMLAQMVYLGYICVSGEAPSMIGRVALGLFCLVSLVGVWELWKQMTSGGPNR